MKVVVTGGNGFLGKNVVSLLQKNKHEVFSISRSENVDIRNYEKFEKHLKKLKADLMIHCAAHVGGIGYNILHPVEVFEDNIIIGINVVKACNETGISDFINIIPNCVYPGNLDEYEESELWDGPVHESVLTYGLPRKMLLGECFAYCLKNPKFKPIHLILPNMYGPNDHFEILRSHALGALVAKIVDAKEKGNKTVEVWGTGKPIREWLYVEDGAEAISKTMGNLNKFASNEVMNIGVKKGITIRDLAFMIKDAVGWDGEFVFNTSKPDGAMKKVLVADKMKSKLMWEPHTNLEEGVNKTVEWYIKHKS